MSFIGATYRMPREQCGNCGRTLYAPKQPCPKCGSQQRVMNLNSPILDLIIRVAHFYKRQKLWLKVLIPTLILGLGTGLGIYATATPGSIFVATETKNVVVNSSEVDAFFTITNVGKKPGISHCVVTVFDNYGGSRVQSKPVYKGVIQPQHTYEGHVLIFIPNHNAANDFNGAINC